MENIKNYEAMAKLDLSEDERAKINDDVNRYFESFDKLLELETEGVQPLVSVLDIKNIFREDISEKKFSRDELLVNALTENDGYFQAAKLLN